MHSEFYQYPIIENRPILFAQSKQFEKIDDFNYVINFKTTDKLKQFIKGRVYEKQGF